MARKSTTLDEQALVADLASGRYTRRALAAKYGVSASLVSKIAHGRRRPGLAARAEELRQSAVELAEQALLRLVARAIEVLEAAMDGEVAPTALRAAQEVLNRTLGKAGAKRSVCPAPARPSAADSPLLAELSPELKRKVVAELGGPTEEAMWSSNPADWPWGRTSGQTAPAEAQRSAPAATDLPADAQPASPGEGTAAEEFPGRTGRLPAEAAAPAPAPMGAGGRPVTRAGAGKSSAAILTTCRTRRLRRR